MIYEHNHDGDKSESFPKFVEFLALFQFISCHFYHPCGPLITCSPAVAIKFPTFLKCNQETDRSLTNKKQSGMLLALCNPHHPHNLTFLYVKLHLPNFCPIYETISTLLNLITTPFLLSICLTSKLCVICKFRKPTLNPHNIRYIYKATLRTTLKGTCT